MSNIQPIYIYILKNTISSAITKVYVIHNCLDTEYYRIYDKNSIIFISFNLYKTYNIKIKTTGFTALYPIPNNYIDNLKATTFDELLDLIIIINNIKNNLWDTSELVNMLQIAIANWDDWN